MRQIGGGSLVLSIEPAPSDERTSLAETVPLWANSHEISRVRVASLLDVFRRRAGAWVSIHEAADELGVENHRDQRIASGVRELLAAGSIEHNGKKRNGSAYRWVDPADEQEDNGAGAVDLALVPPPGVSSADDRGAQERASKYAARARWAIA